MQDLQNGDIAEAFLKVGLGPYGPLVNSLRRAGVVTSGMLTSVKPATRAKYKEELETRTAIEALGNLGLLPFYKDIRRIILKDMYGNKITPEQKKRNALFKKNNPDFFKEPETKNRRQREPRSTREKSDRGTTSRESRTRRRD